MKDEFVKFGTAKLLKQKGFDWECYGTYNVIEEVLMNEYSVTVISHTNKNSTLGDAWISAPTQQMACRWLRKEHNIHIEPHFLRESGDYVYDIIHSPLRFDDIHSFPIVFNTTEDAVEAALQYVLKNLI